MELKFNNLKEFAEHRKINKAIYGCMCYEEKKELKHWVYDILKERKDKKDMIWEYLNEPFDSEDYIRISLVLREIGRKK